MHIIAEAGNNHQGDLSIAKEMIDVAFEAGCDVVKFQTYETERLKGLPQDVLRYLKKAELDRASCEKLITYCGAKPIEFLSSAFDIESLDFLARLGLDVVKIPSGVYNKGFLKTASYLFPNIILSTGMCSLDDVVKNVELVTSYGSFINLLHCTSAYPVPYDEVNLNAIRTLKSYFQVPVGLSDHTLGIEVPIAAAAYGDILEKHFTLDRNMDGPDQKMSIEPDELREMVKCIENVEMAMGNGTKQPTKSEVTERKQ